MNRDLYPIPEAWASQKVRIALIGAGGTGSEVLDGLARLHLALLALGHPEGFHVDVFDPDTVSPTNVIRQRFWPHDVGQNKAVVQVQRLNMTLNLGWNGSPLEADLDNLADYDLVISCVDRASVRAQIGLHANECSTTTFYGFRRNRETLWLDTGNDAAHGQVVLGHLSALARHRSVQGRRLPNVMDLFPEIADMPDDDAPSCSAAEALASQEFGINRLVADTAINLLWQLFRHGTLDHHGAYVSLAPVKVSPMPIDPVSWEGLGYSEPSDAEAA